MKRTAVILVFVMLSALSAFAGEYENALEQGKNVFLYIYTPQCGFCNRFLPRYNKISKQYDRDFTFVKVNGSTLYGYKLSRKFNASYVPYVVMINPKTNYAAHVVPGCLIDSACIDKVLNDFKKDN